MVSLPPEKLFQDRQKGRFYLHPAVSEALLTDWVQGRAEQGHSRPFQTPSLPVHARLCMVKVYLAKLQSSHSSVTRNGGRY